MNIVRKDIDAVNAVLTVQVSKADYEEKVEKTLRDYRKKANIPGFRPGMVPAGLVKKMYGKAVLADEVNKLISEFLYDYIKQNDLRLLGEPLPNETEQPEIDFDTQSDFEFLFDLALTPEFELKLDKEEKIKYYQINPSDEMLQNQRKMYTGRYGSYMQAEEVDEKDVVRGDLLELDAEGKVLENGLKVEAAVLTPKYLKDEEKAKEFIGAKLNATITINPQKIFNSNEAEISSFLKISKEEAKNIASDFQMTIIGITRYKEAEINQELFDKVFGEGVVKTEEEFNAKIRENVEKNLVADSDYKFALDAQETLVQQLAEVQFPEAFLKRWLLAANKNLTEEMVEKDFAAMLLDLKWQLIKNKIIKDNQIKIENADLEDFAKKIVKSQFAQYGMTDAPDNVLEKYAKDMLEKEETARNIAEKVMDAKVIEVVKNAVKLEKKKISIEEFNKMFEK